MIQRSQRKAMPVYVTYCDLPEKGCPHTVTEGMKLWFANTAPAWQTQCLRFINVASISGMVMHHSSFSNKQLI